MIKKPAISIVFVWTLWAVCAILSTRTMAQINPVDCSACEVKNRATAEAPLQTLGLSLLTQDPEKALTVLHFVIDTYPGSAYTLDGLAKGYAQLKRFDLAVKYQQLAVRNAGKLNSWHLNKLQQSLQTYQQALSKI